MNFDSLNILQRIIVEIVEVVFGITWTFVIKKQSVVPHLAVKGFVN